MLDYELISNEWKPYLMRRSPSNVNLPFASTDEIGSRVSYFNGSPLSYEDYRSSQGEYSVLLGNSTGFGVGASSDVNSIPSCLSRLTNQPWYNLSGRAYNQTQEILSLILLGAEKHKNVVVFSGINNLSFSLYFNQLDAMLMPFFGQDTLEKFNNSSADQSRENIPINTKYEKMLCFLDKDLQILNKFTKNSCANIIYVLQPILAWIDKQQHPCERDAAELWDKDNHKYKILNQPSNIVPWKERYTCDLSNLCTKHEISFFDMNQVDCFKQPEHLFFDRTHLTDLGQLRAAENIRDFLYKG